MFKASFVLFAALVLGLVGLSGSGASAFPIILDPVATADAAPGAIVDVRYGGGSYHGGGHYNGYRGNYYHRPYYNHRPAYWNPRYGRRCNGWTNYCRYHYNGYWYSNQWWIAPAVGVGVGVAIAGSNNSRHVAWCEGRYRSYNPRNNTWISNSGKVKQCNSPYN
jgi:BA14K-like protein